MKKIIFLLSGLMVVVSYASEVSALSLFSRQTGMACSSCHYQHFPMLNGFGRAFKSSGYTMMGMQGKVEGEGLAIPNTLNMAVLTTAGYEKTNPRKKPRVTAQSMCREPAGNFPCSSVAG
jgi:hypothetical protein